MIDVISLGAGWQSTCMALMAAHGEIEPMPAMAIFADTGSEPKAVYEHLDWLRSGNALPFPVEIVKWSNLGADIRLTSKGITPEAARTQGRKNGYLAPPLFTRNADGTRGMLRRECTTNYKIRPIRWRVKELLGRTREDIIRSKEPLVRQWIGISADEWVRAGPADVGWVHNWHPLIDRRTKDGPPGQNTRYMDKGDCLAWIKRHGYPEPPRSACVFCPFKSNENWRRLRDTDPEGFEEACQIDEIIRDMPDFERAGLRKGGKLYLHEDRVPLREADIDTDTEDMFRGACMGDCFT